jgi:hypothetical protein
MTNKLELLLQAGCTEAQVKKYERHQTERKAGKTPCPDLRRNYNTCNGRLEVFLRELAKQEANCPHKRQEAKEATQWAIHTAQCLADHTATMPEGYITLDQVFEEVLATCYINGDPTTGKVPALDTIDNAQRDFVLDLKHEFKAFYEDVTVKVAFNGVAFATDLRARLGDLWEKTPKADDWFVGYSQTQPLAVPTAWVRDNLIRKEMANEIIKQMNAHYRSMK